MSMERAREEIRTLHRATDTDEHHDGLGGGHLCFITWHVRNLVRNATDGRYDIVVMRDGKPVEPIDMKYDRGLEEGLGA